MAFKANWGGRVVIAFVRMRGRKIEVEIIGGHTITVPRLAELYDMGFSYMPGSRGMWIRD